MEDLKQKVGQCFIIGVNGFELSLEEENFILEYQPAGIMISSKNYESPAQIAELINSIQDLSKSTPFLICTDHEGGRFQRFKIPFTNMPSAELFGSINNPTFAKINLYFR